LLKVWNKLCDKYSIDVPLSDFKSNLRWKDKDKNIIIFECEKGGIDEP